MYQSFKKVISVLLMLTMLITWTFQSLIVQAEKAENESIQAMSNEGLSEGDTGGSIFFGDSIPGPELEHEITTPGALSIALERVESGEWDDYTLKLTDDITYPYPITMVGGYNVTLDLNGHTLTVEPDNTAEPNVNPESDNPEIAAIYLNQSSLNLTGDGNLDVVAGEGISYGIYTIDEGSFSSFGNYDDPIYNIYVTVTSTGGGTGIYATNKGTIDFDGSILVEGDDIYGIVCLEGSEIYVSDDVSVTGNSACGVYVKSIGADRSDARIGNNLTVSGERSYAGLASGNAWLFVFNSITVTGNQSTGISAEGKESWVMVVGEITAPSDAVKAWNSGYIIIGNSEFEDEEGGNVIVTDENATAVSVVGGNVGILGDVITSGSSGIGISVSAAVLDGSVIGGWAVINGRISASIPLIIEGQPVGENEHIGEQNEWYPDLYIYTDGTSIVLASPSALIPTYTVSFDKNGGDTEASPAIIKVVRNGNIGTMPAFPSRSGYTFKGWNTQADGRGTAFTATTEVTGNITVYAQWSRMSTGEEANTPIETPKTEIEVEGKTATATTTVSASVDSRGNAAAVVTKRQASDIIEKATEEAKKQGEDAIAKVEIKMDAPDDVTTAKTNIPKDAVFLASEAGIGEFTVSTPIASIAFDASALSTLSEEATGDVTITASKVDVSTLPHEVQHVVGDRPVFDFSVTSGDKTISQFGGNVSVSIPYTPHEGEDINAIVIYYINASGELEALTNCIYDSATGRISFSTSHFSQYAVGYNKVDFKDVDKGAWYSKAVSFIAAREITSGTGGGNFSPEAMLTRGQFIVMLMRAYGIAPDIDPEDNFADAGDTYYTGYLAAAKRLGISAGIGNNLYAPEREITRQEMFTLLYNALKVIGKLPFGGVGKPLSAFTDADSISSFAKEAITFFVGTGIIVGNGGKLSPTSTTTRAEMAQVLYQLMSR